MITFSPVAGDRLLLSLTSTHISINRRDCTIHAIIPPSFTLSLEKLHYSEKQPAPSAMTGTAGRLTEPKRRGLNYPQCRKIITLFIKIRFDCQSSFILICRPCSYLQLGLYLINDPPVNSTSGPFDRKETRGTTLTSSGGCAVLRSCGETFAFSCINMTQTSGQVFTQVEPARANETDIK